MITDSHLDKLKAIFVKHGVILAYLFGSHAEGTARPSSDVDIAVLLPFHAPRDTYFDVRLKLIGDLQDVLQCNDVDVIVLNEATALLTHEVVRHGKVLYEDEVTRPWIDFAVRAINYYADTAYLRRLARAYLGEYVQQYRAQRPSSLVAESQHD